MHDLEFVGDYRNPQQLTARQRELGFDGSSAGEFSFDDFLDIINPLQHIPVVSSIYRAITGDAISPHAHIFGDTLFGGPTGFVSAAVGAIYEEIAGEDIGETVLAWFGDGAPGDEPQFATAEAGPVTPAGEAAAPLTTAAGPEQDPAPPATMVHATAGPAESLPAGIGGAGLLTGQDALNALFHDLRGGRTQPLPLPQAGNRDPLPLPGRQGVAEMKSYPLAPRPPQAAPQVGATQALPAAHPPAEPAAAEAPAVHPLIFAQNAAEADLAERMMQALDKYSAMTRERRQDREQTKEETRWQSDPAGGGHS